MDIAVGKRVAANTLILFLGRSLTLGAGVASLSVVTKALGAEPFGLYTLLYAYLGPFMMLVDFGLDQVCVRDLVQRFQGAPGARYSVGRTLGAVIRIRLVLATVALAAGLTGGWILAYPGQFYLLVCIGWLGALATLLGSTFLTVHQARMRTLPIAGTECLSRIATLLLFVGLLVAGSQDIVWFVVGTAVGGIVYAFAAAVVTGRFVSLVWDAPGDYVLSLVRQAWPLAQWIVLGQVVFRIDAFLLGSLPFEPSVRVSPDLALAWFGAAHRFYEFTLHVPGMIMVTLFPAFVAVFEDKGRFRHTFWRSLGVVVVVGGVFATVLSVLAPHIISWLTTPNFLPSVRLLRILALVIPLSFATSVLHGTIVAAGRQGGLVGVYLAALTVNLLANILTIPKYAHEYVPWVVLGTQAVILGGMFLILRHELTRPAN